VPGLAFGGFLTAGRLALRVGQAGLERFHDIDDFVFGFISGSQGDVLALYLALDHVEDTRAYVVTIVVRLKFLASRLSADVSLCHLDGAGFDGWGGDRSIAWCYDRTS
jgi:hypothetical protein